jgi:hypothetical protein
MASHQASVLEFTVEPSDHEDQSVPESFQPNFSRGEADKRGDSLRERLAGHKSRKLRRVRLEYVRARSSPDGPRPAAVHLDEEQLRLKPAKRDPDVLIDAERVLAQYRDRLRHLSEAKRLRCADISGEVLARRHDRDSPSAVTP